MTLIEKMAKAHYEKFPLYMIVDGGDPVMLRWDVPEGQMVGVHASEEVKDRHRKMIRDLLAVAREPSLGMRKACTFEEVEIAWPNLIDAALGEEATSKD